MCVGSAARQVRLFALEAIRWLPVATGRPGVSAGSSGRVGGDSRHQPTQSGPVVVWQPLHRLERIRGGNRHETDQKSRRRARPRADPSRRATRSPFQSNDRCPVAIRRLVTTTDPLESAAALSPSSSHNTTLSGLGRKLPAVRARVSWRPVATADDRLPESTDQPAVASRKPGRPSNWLGAVTKTRQTVQLARALTQTGQTGAHASPPPRSRAIRTRSRTSRIRRTGCRAHSSDASASPGGRDRQSTTDRRVSSRRGSRHGADGPSRSG